MLRGLIRSPGFPSRQWIEERLVDTPCTPDFAQLDERPAHLLFFYDARMSGFRPETDGSLLWDGFTVEPYTMLKTRLGKASYPVVLEKNYEEHAFPAEAVNFDGSVRTLNYKGDSSRVPIKGQVWEIPTKTVLLLDKEMNNTVYYNRKKVKIHVPFHQVMWSKERGDFVTERLIEKVKAWMYVGNDEYWSALAQDPVTHYQANRPINGFDKFYFWTPMEYEIK
jgi:hypothetical protein